MSTSRMPTLSATRNVSARPTASAGPRLSSAIARTAISAPATAGSEPTKYCCRYEPNESRTNAMQVTALR